MRRKFINVINCYLTRNELELLKLFIDDYLKNNQHLMSEKDLTYSYNLKIKINDTINTLNEKNKGRK